MFIPPRELRIKETGQVVSEEIYKADFPFTTFAFDWTPDDAEWVEYIPPPAATEYQEVIRDGVALVNGKWQTAWKVIQTVPKSVPMLNARLALIAAGHMAAIKAYVDGMPGVEGEQARAYLEYAQNVRRDHQLVEGIRQMLGLTPADIDTLFITAATID